MTSLGFDRQIASVYALLDILSDPVKMDQYEEFLAARRAERRARHELKIARLMARLSTKCENVVNQYEQDGFEINKFYTDRHSGNVAVMLVRRNTWNHAASKMGCKIAMVYPNGDRVETMEKSISIRRSF